MAGTTGSFLQLEAQGKHFIPLLLALGDIFFGICRPSEEIRYSFLVCEIVYTAPRACFFFFPFVYEFITVKKRLSF